jgi:hypothetical protein
MILKIWRVEDVYQRFYYECLQSMVNTGNFGDQNYRQVHDMFIRRNAVVKERGPEGERSSPGLHSNGQSASSTHIPPF